MKPLRVLVTGAGGPGTVNLCRSLLAMTPQPWILAVDASAHFLLLALGHERALVPRCDHEEAYLEAIRGLVRDHGIDAILPNNSLEIATLAGARETLGAVTFLPSNETLATANSKWASYKRWKEAGVPVPTTILLNDEGDIEDAFSVLRASEDERVWVRGAGIPGRGIGVASLPCRTPAQACQWVDFWKGWGGMIASTFLPGANLTWMGLFDHGELITSQGRERLAYVIPHVSPSGITGAPAISRTIHDPEVNRLGESAVRALDSAYNGVGFVDMTRDEGGAARVTELNAGRFGTTHYFYTAAGANFPAMLLETALGQRPEAPQRDILPPDLYWIRTLDAGPVLTTGAAIEQGRLPRLAPGQTWPLVAQGMEDFPNHHGELWEGD
jgi:biotin carboxylase